MLCSGRFSNFWTLSFGLDWQMNCLFNLVQHMFKEHTPLKKQQHTRSKGVYCWANNAHIFSRVQRFKLALLFFHRPMQNGKIKNGYRFAGRYLTAYNLFMMAFILRYLFSILRFYLNTISRITHKLLAQWDGRGTRKSKTTEQRLIGLSRNRFGIWKIQMWNYFLSWVAGDNIAGEIVLIKRNKSDFDYKSGYWNFVKSECRLQLHYILRFR